jgi:hypothetical protein
MKIKTRMTIGAAILFASVFYASSQQSAVDPRLPPESDIFDASVYEPIGYDPVTLEAVSPKDGTTDFSGLNTPGQIEKRKLAVLEATNPAEYFRRFPKSQERLDAEAASRASVLKPMTLEEKRATQTTSQNLADAKAIVALFDVRGGRQGKTESAPQQPPPGAFDSGTIAQPAAGTE